MKKLKNSFTDFLKKSALLLMGWTVSPFVHCYSWVSEKTGRLKVVGSFPKGGSLLIVGNHESFGDPPEITMKVYLSDPINFTNPIQYFPWIMQAEDNFLRYLFFLRAHIAIWVDRREGKTMSRMLALRKAKRILDNGGNVILFPGGMRDRNILQKKGVPRDGEILGDLFDGVGWLATHCSSKVRVVPFGTKGYADFMPNDKIPIPRFWVKREIRVGKPFRISPGTSIKEATQQIRKTILEQKNKGVRK